MIVRSNVIMQGQPDEFRDRWVTSAQAQAILPGFVEAKLYRVYRLLNKTPYHYLSVIEWMDADACEKSFHHGGHPTFLDVAPTNSIANTYTLINSAQHVNNGFSTGHITVINPYSIPVDEVEKYAPMWDHFARHMEAKDGFVSAQLYRAVRNDEHFCPISRAEWQSEQHFLKQFEGADFRKIVAPFEGIFSISLSRLQAHVTCNNLWLSSQNEPTLTKELV